MEAKGPLSILTQYTEAEPRSTTQTLKHCVQTEPLRKHPEDWKEHNDSPNNLTYSISSADLQL